MFFYYNFTNKTIMMKKLVIFSLFFILFNSCKESSKTKTTLPTVSFFNSTETGPIFGTYYKIQLFDSVQHNYEKQYDSLFFVINKSMSTYWDNSLITQINKGDSTVLVDEHFKYIFNTSKKIYKESEGFFDPTIGVMVNAWDFGPGNSEEELDSLKINNLMQSVGFDKVNLVDNKIQKAKNTFIDFNAIAKGYGLDVIANFLDARGYQNYLIDIGGEIIAKGSHLVKNKPFNIAIEKPNFDDTRSQQILISLKNEAMASSGIYRKFKIDENGNRYAHIINPKTGYPSKTNILSVSVIAPNCTLADAYATAFKAMGIDKVKAFLQKHPELKVYFIFEDSSKNIQTLALNNFPE